MSDTPAPLPQTFEVTQGKRLAAAHDVGDHAAVERVRRHLVTEGSIDSADAAQLDDFTRAMVLGKEIIDASTVGNHERAAELSHRMTTEFELDTVVMVTQAMLFTAGRQQGWLPECDYDTLASFTKDSGHEITSIVRQIRRGRPPA